ncbi:uncharacterized protein [Drosophila kikkawai]|uniref:Uncharacterized protein n=1 Tax=Drosophila kikkawai TaxID=30033 RepID=A0ABM3C5E1_DROKI|nr:uncharacterized protein LOC121502170 [Drosophila kikkawai]
MVISAAASECQPRIKSYPVSSPKELESSKVFQRSPIAMDSNDNLGGKPAVSSSFLYKNKFNGNFSEDGDEAEIDTSDDAGTMNNDTETDAITLKTLTSRQKIPPEQEQPELEQLPLSSFVRTKSVPDSRFSGFLRVLARSLQHCSVRIAAGFGLSRQPNAWYKNCWNTPGSQTQRIHRGVITLAPESMATMPRGIASSTTL